MLSLSFITSYQKLPWLPFGLKVIYNSNRSAPVASVVLRTSQQTLGSWYWLLCHPEMTKYSYYKNRNKPFYVSFAAVAQLLALESNQQSRASCDSSRIEPQGNQWPHFTNNGIYCPFPISYSAFPLLLEFMSYTQKSNSWIFEFCFLILHF